MQRALAALSVLVLLGLPAGSAETTITIPTSNAASITNTLVDAQSASGEAIEQFIAIAGGQAIQAVQQVEDGLPAGVVIPEGHINRIEEAAIEAALVQVAIAQDATITVIGQGGDAGMDKVSEARSAAADADAAGENAVNGGSAVALAALGAACGPVGVPPACAGASIVGAASDTAGALAEQAAETAVGAVPTQTLGAVTELVSGFIAERDGITARITTPSGVGDLVFLPDADGNYVVDVTIFRDVGGSWQPIALAATVRAFTFDVATLSEDDRVSVPFQSSASGPVRVTFPATALGASPNGFDLFVTFSQLGGNPVPTSHHSPMKNAAIAAGLFTLADQLDSHSVRPIGL